MAKVKNKITWIIKGIVYLVALIYLLLPIDFIPDALPVIGTIDDAVGGIISIGVGEILNFMKKK